MIKASDATLMVAQKKSSPSPPLPWRPLSSGLALAALSTQENAAVAKIAALATGWTGVQFDGRHESMLRSRLQTRMREIPVATFDSYLAYVKANLSTESIKVIASLTTHHTYFFREFAHFEHLAESGLALVANRARAQGRKVIKIWSAACSRGQEVYSLAMWLDMHLKRVAPGMSYEILGTDVDAESVATAKNGVYKFNELKEIPLPLLEPNWARGTGAIKEFAKAKESIRNRCRFEVDNLISLQCPTSEKFDIIFCRNVFIYFTPEQTAGISRDLLERLDGGGLLYVGISESLHGMNVGAKSIGPSIYQKPSVETATLAPPRAAAPSLPVPIAKPAPIRVFCVDDSPVVLKLLSRIFSSESGFEMVGNACHGLDAKEKLKSAGHVDVVTLDIHMPEQNGIEYLTKNFGPLHPPVVIISSASRESSGLALDALNRGASDFVEKPAFAKMEQSADEIRAKVKLAALSARTKTKPALGLDKAFERASKSISNPESKLQLFISFGLTGHERMLAVIRAAQGPTQPPTVLLVDAAPAAVEAIQTKLRNTAGVVAKDASSSLTSGQSAVIEWTTGLSWLRANGHQFQRTAAMVFGDLPKSAAIDLAQVLAGRPHAFYLEDLGGGAGTAALMDKASDVAPSTSFAYFASVYLCESK